MDTFGTIKSKIESASVKHYGKKTFNSFMKGLKSNLLENKDLAELYYIYDDLSEKKGLDKTIATDYINETIEYSQVLLENNLNSIIRLNEWANKVSPDSKNNYQDIDNVVYIKSIRNLETLLESKKNILNIISSKNETKINESINLPISSMLKVANQNLNSELKNISESDLKEIESLSNMTKEELKENIIKIQESIIPKLKSTLNESTDSSVQSKIEQTIQKIKNSPIDKYNLYQLRKLNQGL